jgi:hypothetical protein
MSTSTKYPEQYAALAHLAERLEADFGAECSLEPIPPMLDVRMRGELYVVDYDNGAEWQPRNQYSVAQVTMDYGFNLSSDPRFATLELAEQYLRERLKLLV